MSFHRVLVAFDGSHESEAALALGLRLRDPADGVLTLACVVTGQRWHVAPHVHRTDAPVPDEIARMFADARATTIPPGVHVRQRAPVAPSPARGLTELAEREDADLIVVGSSRHGEASRVRLERTAGRLLQGAPCAVAIAPAAQRDTDDFRHVGIAYDGSPEARTALDAGYEIAARCGAAATLLWALPVDSLGREGRLHVEEALDAAAEAAPAAVNPRTLLLHGEPADAIRRESDGIVDLLVTGSRGYGPLHRALLGSVSESLAEGSPHPVLVLPRRPAPAADEPAPTLEATEAR